MFPMLADLTRLPVLLIGGGGQAERRCQLLKEAGAARLRVLTPSPSDALIALAGEALERREPVPEDFAAARIVFVADCERGKAEALAKEARAAGCFVNVEDMTALCDFHVPAMVRRGDLVITVSTGGRSPALARAIRDDLAARYEPEWAARVAAIGTARDAWRAEGLSLPEISARSAALIAEKGWMP
ncbi:MAG: siroheme synthase [Alphaproteobacteria bacterium]|nr:siroheme synthase [Alphaproteobacteria bacterium]